MGTGLPITVVIGLIVSLGLLGYCIWSGRSAPTRRWAWILGLVLLGLSLIPRVFLAVAMGVESGGWGNSIPIGIGTLALVATFVAAFWRPVRVGWFLIASAAVTPALLWIVQLLIGESQDNVIPAFALLATYSLPVAVISVFLVLSGSRGPRLTDEQPGVAVTGSDARAIR